MVWFIVNLVGPANSNLTSQLLRQFAARQLVTFSKGVLLSRLSATHKAALYEICSHHPKPERNNEKK